MDHVKRMRPGEWGEWWRLYLRLLQVKDGWVVYWELRGCEWNREGGGRGLIRKWGVGGGGVDGVPAFAGVGYVWG